jgi:antitoxin MazE
MDNHIRARDVKLIPIGNSRGIRIPKTLLQKYGLKNSL